MKGKLLFSFFVCTLLTAVVYGQAPVADFSVTGATTGCPDLIVSFSDQSTNGPNTLTWNFGGAPPDVVGGIPNAPNQTIIFHTPGTYT
ncbi:MAG: hypothetical protein ACHQEM_00370, partial [Chitinophagales bacterium]